MDQCDRIAPWAWCIDFRQERKEFFVTPSFVEGSAYGPYAALPRDCAILKEWIGLHLNPSFLCDFCWNPWRWSMRRR